MTEKPQTTSTDLSPTGLYTAGVWAWAKMPGAHLLDHKDTRNVFGVVNFALGVARLLGSRTPSLRHSLVQRHVMIDELLKDSRAACVLEIAAGLSARGVRATADPAITYVEVDQPGVIERKRRLLEQTAEGRAVVERTNLKLVGADAVKTPFTELLPEGAHPNFVIAEGLLMYLDRPSRRELFRRVRALLDEQGGDFVFDLVPPRDQPAPGALGRLLGKMMRALTRGGDFVRDETSRDDILSDLRDAGFSDVRALEPSGAPASWSVPHLELKTQQLVFAAHAKRKRS